MALYFLQLLNLKKRKWLLQDERVTISQSQAVNKETQRSFAFKVSSDKTIIDFATEVKQVMCQTRFQFQNKNQDTKFKNVLDFIYQNVSWIGEKLTFSEFCKEKNQRQTGWFT